MTVIPIHFPLETKRQLDALRLSGFTIAGFVRRAVQRELDRTLPAPRRRTRRASHGK
jgi:hypothetical protein